MMDRQLFPHELYSLYHMPQYHYPSFYADQFRTFSLPSRPAELGLAQLHHQQQQQQQQHHRQQQQQQQTPQTHHHHQIINYQNLCQTQLPLSISQPDMAYMQSEEFDEFQQLSNAYQPDATGPLVSVKQSSSAVTAEYASADPIYQDKTANLSRKYPSYRTCRGDGNCGWRAIAFGYYESLLRTGDHNRFLQEEVRLKSLRNTCSAAGHDLSILEDFEELALDLLKDTAATLHMPDAEDTLVTAFNNDEMQNYIIVYFRQLTAAWIQTRAELFAPFVLPRSVEEYCSTSIMSINTEIEDAGINALTEILLKPAGIALEIIHLDRSEGVEANVHRFGPMTASVATIRLLYRPGHYDILYKAEDGVHMQSTAQSSARDPQYSDVPTYQAAPGQTTFSERCVPDSIVDLPGMSYVEPNMSWSTGSFYEGGMLEAAVLNDLQHVQTPIECMPAVFSQVVHFEDLRPHHELASGMSGLPIRSGIPSRPVPQRDSFRPSRHMYEHQLLPAPTVAQDVEFRTAQFKNSHHNRSHFRNVDFQPEPWDPSTEYVTINTRNNRRGRRFAS